MEGTIGQLNRLFIISIILIFSILLIGEIDRNIQLIPDALAEEGSMLPGEEEEDDDLVFEDDEETSYLPEGDESSSLINLDIKQLLFFQVGKKEKDKGYRENADDTSITKKDVLDLEYNVKMNLQASINTRFYLDLSVKFQREYDRSASSGVKESFEETFSLKINEGYIENSIDRHFFKTGKQKIYFLLPLTEYLESPFDFFNMSERKPFSVRYLWSPDANNSLSVYYSPIYIRSEAENETITRAEQNSDIKSELGNIKDHTPYRDHYGLVYKLSLMHADWKVGFFRWADKNLTKFGSETDITTTPTPHSEQASLFPSAPSDVFFEKEADDVLLSLLGFSLTLSDLDIKLDAAHFKNRTFYHLFKSTSTATNILVDPDTGSNVNYTTSTTTQEQKSYRIPHTLLNLSVEKHWKYMYLMLMITQQKLSDVPADTNIFMYENEETLKSSKRDIYKNEYVVGLVSGFSDQIKLILNHYRSYPFQVKITTFNALWTPLTSDLQYTFAYKQMETEVLQATNQAIKETNASMGVIYNF